MNFIKNLSRQTQQLLRRGQQHWHWHWLDGVILVAIIIAFGGLLWIKSQRQSQWITVRIEISQEEWWWKGDGPEYWYLNQLQPGTISYNSFGSQVAEVTKVDLVDIGEGRRHAIVTAKLKVEYDSRNQQYVFGFQPLQVGRGIELSFGRQQVKGLVTTVDQSPATTVERLIRVRMNKVDPQVAKAYHVGLTAVTNNQETVATVTQLKVTPALEAYFSDIRNQIVQVVNPSYVDVMAVLKLQLSKDGDQYYFADGTPVKIGGEFTIQFPQTLFQRAQVLEWVDTVAQ